ncbi:hypothetical protein [Paenibacillus ihuae]|uniref:hypothetical protein n=1 Tax=Paenibacillus ihuae TaxID=1232431 RepID=UPI0006D59EF3|nr:hypothetical protein [Paenibacillus ihuae]
MKLNIKTPVLVTVSIVLIIVSSMLRPEGSTVLGALQTLLLGLGILGCLMAFLRFTKSATVKGKDADKGKSKNKGNSKGK